MYAAAARKLEVAFCCNSVGFHHAHAAGLLFFSVLRLFLFHHLRLVQLAEASLERTFAALLLETSDVCGISDGSVTCSEAKQLVAAPVDPEDPQFAVPDFLRQLVGSASCLLECMHLVFAPIFAIFLVNSPLLIVPIILCAGPAAKGSRALGSSPPNNKTKKTDNLHS